ncbi:MAG: response regulator [Eubacteriales bacterium]|nr:response regulator [Eubacteriales bacterium]
MINNTDSEKTSLSANVGKSIGGVISNPENETVNEAVIRADKLMYQAKIQKNRVGTEKSRKLTLDAETADITNELKQQILIVDDSEINREILSEALHGEFRILEAKNGRECIDILDEYGTGISLVMLDLMMPVMTGIDAAKAIRNSDRSDAKTVPIAAMTANNLYEDIAECEKVGMNGLLAKPLKADCLTELINNLEKTKFYTK